VLCGGSSVELRELLADADRGLVVGSDLDAVSTASWSVSLPESLIHVTLDGDDIGFGYEADLGSSRTPIGSSARSGTGWRASTRQTDRPAHRPRRPAPRERRPFDLRTASDSTRSPPGVPRATPSAPSRSSAKSARRSRLTPSSPRTPTDLVSGSSSRSPRPVPLGT